MLASLLIHIAAVRKIDWKSLDMPTTWNAATFILLGFFRNAILSLFMFVSRPHYFKIRHIILLVLILLKVLEAEMFFMRTSAVELFYPIQELPESSFRCFLRVLKFPMHLARMNMAYVLPIPYLYIISLPEILSAMLYTPGRCYQELSSFPEQGNRYRQLGMAFESYFYKDFPLPPGAFGISNPRFSTLSTFDACIAINTWAQLFCSIMLPLVLLAVEETLSRKAFERTHELGEGYTHGFTGLIIRHMALLIITSGVAFHSIMVGLSAKPLLLKMMISLGGWNYFDMLYH